MKNLIIDANREEVFFSIIAESQSYTTKHTNSRENFDKFVGLLLTFLKKHKTEIKDIEKIFVNQGPGKFSGIRASISTAKALSITNKINLYGFCSTDVNGQNYQKIIDLYNKGILIKNLIKPQYSS